MVSEDASGKNSGDFGEAGFVGHEVDLGGDHREYALKY